VILVALIGALARASTPSSMTAIARDMELAVRNRDSRQLAAIATAGMTRLNPNLKTSAFLADDNYVPATAAQVLDDLRGCSFSGSHVSEPVDGKVTPAVGAYTSWSCSRPATFLPEAYPKRECYDVEYILNAKPKGGAVSLMLFPSLTWNSTRCGARWVPPPPPAPPPGWKKERG
jgi:hypothetical protein